MPLEKTQLKRVEPFDFSLFSPLYSNNECARP